MDLLVVLKNKWIVATKIGNSCTLHYYEAKMINISPIAY